MLIILRLIFMIFMHRLQVSDGVNMPIAKYEVPTMFTINFVSFLTVLLSFTSMYSDLSPSLRMWCFAELLNSALLLPYNILISNVITRSINENLREVFENMDGS